MAPVSTFVRLHTALRQVENTFLRWTGLLSNHYPPGLQPALVEIPDLQEFESSSSSESLSSLFGAILWNVNPKKRRSRERRQTRRFGQHAIIKHSLSKKNVEPCLTCGHYVEWGQLCRNCYNVVKEETMEMMNAMGETLKYNIPKTELEFRYENDIEKEEENSSRPKYKGKYIVEIKKKRPQWFSDVLMSKVKR